MIDDDRLEHRSVMSLFRFGRSLPRHFRYFASLTEAQSKRDVMSETLTAQIAEVKASGKYKEERIITSPQSEAISPLRRRIRKFETLFVSRACRWPTCPESMYLLRYGRHVRRVSTAACVGSNNYLGLSNHPKILEAAQAAIRSHGYGLSSVRFICGTQVASEITRSVWRIVVALQDVHKQLEDKISAFHGTEDTILYTSCFDANAGLFEALLTKDDIVFSDALNHASIIDGIRLCKVRSSSMCDLR